MLWGTSYYPELVPEDEWERDLDLMRENGIGLIRMLDFAWTAIEPREGCYEFAWLDRFLDLAGARGIKIILCTPTATPPAWLARQYPEIMIENRDGSRRRWGARRDADVDSEIYRHFSAAVAGALGARYGTHPAVIGWQIDNELLGPEGVPPECHSRASQWRFRDFLKRRHGTVDDVNERWGLRFWNQEYSDWGEIETPKNDRSCVGYYVDYARYFSESQREFLEVQAKVLRDNIADEQWISHNATAVFDRGLDHITMADALDVTGWDAYFGAAAGCVGKYRPQFSALAHDMFRAMKHAPFYIFETNPFSAPAYPAYYAEMAARGAAAVIVWHWRGHRFNVEQGCGTVCDFDGRPFERKLEMLKSLRERPEFAHTGSLPCGRRDAAILYSPDCVRADTTPNPYHRARTMKHLESLASLYQALWRLGVAVDVVRPGADLSGYKLVAVPGTELLGRENGARLVDAATAGAVVLACAPLGYKDEYGVYYRDLGEPVSALTNFTMRVAPRAPARMTVRATNGRTYDDAPVLAHVSRTDGDVLAEFVERGEVGDIAAYARPCGDGKAFFVATSHDELNHYVAEKAADAAGLATAVHEHPDVSVLRDFAGKGTWYFNHGIETRTVGDVAIPGGDFRLV